MLGFSKYKSYPNFKLFNKTKFGLYYQLLKGRCQKYSEGGAQMIFFGGGQNILIKTRGMEMNFTHDGGGGGAPLFHLVWGGEC